MVRTGLSDRVVDAFVAATLLLLGVHGECRGAPHVSFDTTYREARARNPKGVTFTVRLKDGKTTYRQGEVIRIELGFSSSVPGKFVLDGATYDRSGRLDIDAYKVDPVEHVFDPLRDYFAHGFSVGGGLRPMPILSAEPYKIVREVNEHIRFEEPGRYRMFVASNRIRTESPAEGGEFKTRHHGVASNMIEFEVVPADAEWAAAELRRSIDELGTPGGRGSGAVGSRPDDGNADAAAKRIRYLGTRAAVREMVRRLGNHTDPHHWDFKFGLIGSPHRAFVLEEMEKGLDEAETITSESYLRILVLMKYCHLHPGPEMPHPGTADKEKLEAWRAQCRRRDADQERLRAGYAARLARALDQKREAARANALNTLLGLTEHSSSVPPEVAERLPEDIARDFHLLSPAEQGALLNYRWHLFGGPHMLPQLRRLYNRTYKQSRQVPGVALRRIYELEPEEGRKLILKEIRNPRPGVHFLSLLILPDEPIPELHNALVARISDYGRGSQEACHHLERYATAVILPRVREVYERKSWDTRSRARACLLAYFLRVDPPLGAKYVEEAIKEAAAKPRGSFYLLRETGERHYCPELEMIAVASLGNPSLGVVADAARVLGEHGSPGVEEALWKRLERWYDRWKGRPEKLRWSRVDREKRNEAAALVGSSLRQALICATHWFAGADKLRKIKSLTVLPRDREQIDYRIAAHGPEMNLSIHIHSTSGEWGNVRAAQYECSSIEAAKRKLAQFPRGTVLVWRNNAVNAQTEGTAAVFLELKASLEPSGVVLRSAVPVSSKARDTRR